MVCHCDGHKNLYPMQGIHPPLMLQNESLFNDQHPTREVPYFLYLGYLVVSFRGIFVVTLSTRH